MKAPGERVRWRWILPAVMGSLALCLVATSPYQWDLVRGAGTGWVSSADGLLILLNCPVSIPDRITATDRLWVTFDCHSFAVGRLIWIAALWFWIGWMIDTSHRRRRVLSLDLKIVASLGYTALLLLCCAAIYASSFDLRFWFEPRALFETLPQILNHWKLIVAISWSLWGSAGLVYVVRKLIQIWRSGTAAAVS